jgi:hypothetical protein
MHKNSLILYGAPHGELFSGVIWRDSDEESFQLTKFKIQEMLDACYELAEGQCGGNLNQTDELVDRLINSWLRTGSVD